MTEHAPVLGRGARSAATQEARPIDAYRLDPWHFALQHQYAPHRSWPSAALDAIYVGGFGLSHPLAKKIGAWPAVLSVAAVSAGASWALVDRAR